MTDPELNLTGEAPESPPQPKALPLQAQPSPRSHAPVEQGPGFLDRIINLVEMRPLAAAAVIFVALVLLHILMLDLGGAASGLFVDGALFFMSGAGIIDVLMLAFIAYNVVLPTLLARACLTAFADTSPALSCNDATYDNCLEDLASPHLLVRMVFAGFWAFVLTPEFGQIFQGSIPGTAQSAFLLTIWMYVRIAVIFGLLGSTITYIAMLHYRFSAATGAHLRIDLFDLSPLQPLSRYARSAALCLMILPALVGPAIAQPQAMNASATLLALVASLILFAVMGALWGARRAIRGARLAALSEIQAYSREIWRRAYVSGRIVEAVALPAMAAMLTVRREIVWQSDWPGGWPNIIRLVALAAIPVSTWFGGQIASFLLATFVP